MTRDLFAEADLVLSRCILPSLIIPQERPWYQLSDAAKTKTYRTFHVINPREADVARALTAGTLSGRDGSLDTGPPGTASQPAPVPALTSTKLKLSE